MTRREKTKKNIQKNNPTLAGLEPTRDKPNRFLVDRLNRSATVSFLVLVGKTAHIPRFTTLT